MLKHVVFILSLMMAPALWAQEAETLVSEPQSLETCLSDKPFNQHERCIGLASDACMEREGGASTTGMSGCLDQELALWDQKLNDAYKALMVASEQADAAMKEAGAKDANHAELLKNMQRQWMAYRDAACAFDRAQWGEGSGGGPAGLKCHLTLTAVQALRLQGQQNRIGDM